MMTPLNIPHTDLSLQQLAIAEKYGERWYASDEATGEAAALWGIAGQPDVINVHGGFLNAEEEILAQAGRCWAVAKFAHAPNGMWAVSTGYQLPESGYGGPVSVWNRKAYPSRDAARLAAIQDLIWRISGGNQKGSEHILPLLEAEKTPQLSLF